MDLDKLVLEAKKGSETAMEEIVSKFKGFIYKASKEIYISGYDLEDLLQIGYESLIKAVMKYDRSKNNNFTSYAIRAINNNYFYEIRQKSRYNSETSLNKEIDEDLNLIDLFATEECIEEDYIIREEHEQLREAIKLLKAEERELIEYVYINEGRLVDYAKLKNIKYVTCVKFKDRILCKLRKTIKEKEI